MELAKIHLAKKRLGLDEVAYRGIVARVGGGKTSAGDLDERQRGALLDEFKRFGFCEGASYSKRLDDFTDREPQARLIRCLWSDLVACGAITKPSEKALQKFIKRTGGVDRIEWLSATQANACIEGLKAWKARVGHRQRSTGR